MKLSKKRLRYGIKKDTVEWVAITLLIIFSFINSLTLSISLVLLLVLLKQKEIGAIKIINIITLRTIINPSIAVDIENIQSIKWLLLFGCSIFLLFAYFKLKAKELRKINSISIILLLFVAYNIFVALAFSSLPTVAIFKLASYSIIFLGVLTGVAFTYEKIDWLKWMTHLLALLIITSFVLILFSVGYYKGSMSFQGITNQPNMFGIIAVLFVGSALTYVRVNPTINKLYYFLLLMLTFLMIIISESRTSFISSVVLIITFLLFSKIKSFSSLFLAILAMISFISFILGSNLKDFIMQFLYKGQNEGNLIDSRVDQIENLTTNFLANPLFGSGFAIPVLPFRSYEFNHDYIVESGNLFIAVLSYSGIIGFIIFSAYVIKIIISNKRNFKAMGLLLIAVILINMGEMVFFSSNNIGIWCYMFLTIYVFEDLDSSKSKENFQS